MDSNIYLISIIGPATEFHVTMLIIKWKPCYVYFTCAFKNTRRHVQTTAITFNYDICMVCAIEFLISAVNCKYTFNFIAQFNMIIENNWSVQKKKQTVRIYDV